MQRKLAALLAVTASLALAQPQAADFKPRTIKISYGTAEDHPFGIGVNKFVELLAQKSGGQMKAKGFAQGQLGAEVPSLSSAQGGVIEMAVTSTSPVVGNVKDFALFDFPYLFANEKEADMLLDGPVGPSSRPRG